MDVPSALRRWRNDASIAVKELWGGYWLAASRDDATRRAGPDDWQTDVLQKFNGKKRIAIKACKGPGKTALLAWMALIFLITRPMCRVACTSITGDNLRDNLWAEMSLWISRSPFLSAVLRVSDERIYVLGHKKHWFITARTWAKDANEEQQANTLAGLHADYLLFIIDEAGGVPDAVAAAAEGGLATGLETKLIIAGNPTHSAGPLFRAFTRDVALWWTKTITADPDDPNRTPRVSVEWARDQITIFGRDSAWCRTNVFAEFPIQSSDSLCALSWFEQAAARYREPHPDEPKTMGVDVARFGPDENFAVICCANQVVSVHRWGGMDSSFTQGMIRKLAMEHGVPAENVRVDSCGIGGPMVDNLHAADPPFRCVGVDVSLESRLDMFRILRDEYSWSAREELRLGLVGINPEILATTTLADEGSGLRYRFSAAGNQIKIQSKDEYRAKHKNKSPDVWDAYVLARCVAHSPNAGLLAFMRSALVIHKETEAEE